MSLSTILYLTALLGGAELLYLKLARQFRFFDLPNARSLHQNRTTVRGGGVIFYLAVLAALGVEQSNQSFFLIGLTVVATVSFADDVYGLPVPYRLGSHLIGVVALLMQTSTLPADGWVLPVLLIAGVGVLNAFNFMDGINGMTAFYSLVTVSTMWFLNLKATGSPAFVLYPALLIALLTFAYFNARRHAVCFAGDVGSISIGFISLYLLITLINSYGTYLPVLLLAVYGIDTSLTLENRIRLRQPILQAHRSHLFQLLVHEGRLSHRQVAASYALLQAGVNTLVVWAIDWPAKEQLVLAGLLLSSLALLYTGLKQYLKNQ